VLSTVLILAGGIAVIAAVAYRRSRITTPITAIAQAADATLVRIRGRVACAEPLRAPYSGRPCVFYKVEVVCIQFNHRLHYQHTDSCELIVTDATGIARILPGRAQFEAYADVGEATRASRISERARELIQQMEWPLPEIAGVQISEHAIAIHDEVDVAGIPMREVHATEARERGFRDEPPTQLVFAGDVYVLKAGRTTIGPPSS